MFALVWNIVKYQLTYEAGRNFPTNSTPHINTGLNGLGVWGNECQNDEDSTYFQHLHRNNHYNPKTSISNHFHSLTAK